MIRPKISIIIPIYKAEAYLNRCIDSLLHQTFTEFEIILIDDGSPDNSGKICDNYAKMDPRIHVIHKKNGGVSAARQTGLEFAKGDFIIHADPDDWVESNMLCSLYKKVTEEDADMVICDIIEEFEWGKIIQKQCPRSFDSKTVLHDLFTFIHGSCVNKLTKRSIINEFNIHFPNGLNFCEDLFFNISLLLHPIKVCYLNQAFYHYDHMINKNSLVSSRKNPVDSTKVLISKLEDLMGEEYNNLINIKKCKAKILCINSCQSYKYFKRTYPEVDNQLRLIEISEKELSILSFANKGRLFYYFAVIIHRLKELIFKLRHLL